MLVACAVILGSIGVYTTAQAANLTFISDTLTDSSPSAQSGHDISFTIATGSALVNTEDISITFPSGFTTVASTTVGDITVTVDGGADTATNFSAVGQVVSFDGIDATQGQVVRIVIAADAITNPASPQSYEIVVQLANADSDTGRPRVAIVQNVTVSAVVETTFVFTVNSTASSTAINGETTTGSTTATTIPFGVLQADTEYTLGQQLTVQTNAANGFVVTVEQDGNLESSTGADIDGFLNGEYTNTPTAWAAPSDSLLQENTWGHWGLTTNDSDLGGTFGTPNTGEFANGGSGDRWVAASTTPREIFSHDGPSDGTSQNTGLASVAYKVEITPLQEAGDDYTTTLMYIATPTF
ncbi:hypothetical protein A3I99_01845 [Candidatus Kaiserbacteria bacterium RIFCSPLOWO2_02_FULL_45_11b]|uniref:WxL domain-containing protein n=1 Tax=Candidatus Kaiserbacteria bacterium RIFCSPLOWO2_12_FULL_45_26 TaxID=1798525 RepID=A0A1F6FGM3_9BACT|nr:MAG: hypothetical protein A2Z56_03740 [Candidatus Kaiserbacteria bacterium RIFCSPHIGHO2_12_45_16]OGG71080.1 MAG: hypothetical protein A2929_02010 [Candidatus Kaiserbacteria bacterium RIFCSPLOWO2_01_FULL_45_25]OGG83568.1 MAG: hypothetical protein A3I99_01845 [Candidatus Kaiserbacteria bacterium RIFCSPLOWO2_02_FULL_45_11b]OGG85006.1 MAG: hypothetical protein A3G90_03000 [Candidatus Kaiserbacteria bacterium RIFCSPLOWO2_12_FULL_45_26]